MPEQTNRPETIQAGAGRMSAAAVARDRAKRLRRKADALDQIADMIIKVEGDFDDSALWEMLIEVR